MSAPEGLTAPFVLEYAYKRSTGPVIGGFLTQLRAGQITAVKTATGRVLCPPTEYDPETGEDTDPTPIPVGPGGVLKTCCNGWGLIQLDGADTAMVHRVSGEVARGDRVFAVWADQRAGSINDILHFAAEGNTPTPQAPAEPITRFKSPTRLEYTVDAGALRNAFLTDLKNGKLWGDRCTDTGSVYFPPRGISPTSGKVMTERVPVSEIGTVTTFSVIRVPFEGQLLTPPYACAHIVLDGSDTTLLHIVGGCDVNDVRMGMRVQAVWRPPEERGPSLENIHYFAPTDEPDAEFNTYEKHL
ncbi:MAG: putative OB-fold protein [Myxococcota bacterium]|jgi:uncharacterized OB-fold protein